METREIRIQDFAAEHHLARHARGLAGGVRARFEADHRVAFFTGEQNTDWAAVMAASVLKSAPVLVICVTFQRFFGHGLAEGAVKG